MLEDLKATSASKVYPSTLYALDYTVTDAINVLRVTVRGGKRYRPS